MGQALNLIYYVYDKLIDFIFNKLEFGRNVTVGWVIVVCWVLLIMIKNILALPRSAHGSIRLGDKKDE